MRCSKYGSLNDLTGFLFILVLLQLTGCASAPGVVLVTPYSLQSNPPGAKIYRGTSPGNMTYYQTTPFQHTAYGEATLGWSNKYFQARKEGYKDSEIYMQPLFAMGNPTVISFDLQQEAGEEVLVPYQRRNTVAGYYEFLSVYPENSVKQKVFGLMVALIALSPSKSAEYKRLVDQYPDALSSLPESARLDLVGPSGMTVADLRDLLKQGIGAAILEQKIISAGQPYAEFSFAEIKRLTKMGFSDQLIAAMLKVTQGHKVNQQAAAQAKQVAAANSLMLRNQQAAAARAVSVAAPQSPGVGDKLAECAVMIAKKKACDQIGGFGGMACMALLPGGHNCF